MRVFDYLCENGHMHEAFVASADVEHTTCEECGSIATRQLAAPGFKLEGVSGHFPSAGMSWQRKREERMVVERKHKANHGTEWLGKSEGFLPKKSDFTK